MIVGLKKIFSHVIQKYKYNTLIYLSFNQFIFQHKLGQVGTIGQFTQISAVHKYPVFHEDGQVVHHGLVPDEPQAVVEGERDEQVLVDLDPRACQGSGTQSNGHGVIQGTTSGVKWRAYSETSIVLVQSYVHECFTVITYAYNTQGVCEFKLQAFYTLNMSNKI